MKKRVIGCLLIVMMIIGLVGNAHAQEERVQKMEDNLKSWGVSEDDQRYVLDIYRAALIGDTIDITVVVDRVVNGADEAETAWYGLDIFLMIFDQTDAFWTEMILRRATFPTGSYFAQKIEYEMESREEIAQVEIVRIWLAAQGIGFPEVSRTEDGDMLKIADALAKLSDAELGEWYLPVMTALDLELTISKFYDEVVPFIIADEQYAPSLARLMLPEYIEYLVVVTINNTLNYAKFYGDTEEYVKPILERLTRVAHPGYPVDYQALIEALEALDEADIKLLYPQLSRFVSLMSGRYELLLDAYIAGETARPGAPLYDLLMAERAEKLARPFWTPRDLKLFYKFAFDEDGIPQFAPAVPEAKAVLLICEDEDRDTLLALFDLLQGAGIHLTSDPDRAQFALVYQVTHGASDKDGNYYSGGRPVVARSTTATLRLTELSTLPVERARISETNQPGNVITVTKGSYAYNAPEPVLQESRNGSHLSLK